MGPHTQYFRPRGFPLMNRSFFINANSWGSDMAIDKKRATANQQQHLQSVLLNLIMVLPLSLISYNSELDGRRYFRCPLLLFNTHLPWSMCCSNWEKCLINLDGTCIYKIWKKISSASKCICYIPACASIYTCASPALIAGGVWCSHGIHTVLYLLLSVL